MHDYPAETFWNTSVEDSSLLVDHSLWQAVLDKHLVSNTESGIALFDYQGLLADSAEDLSSYLNALATIDIRAYSRAEQFAYWVNLYNALTVDLVAKHYPVDSIKKIYGGWFNRGPWDEEIFSVQGVDLSLNDIEHRILRPMWRDYRIHFVVNCASLGCPNLPAQALTASNTQNVLEQSAAEFLSHPRGMKIEANGIQLSSIFKWYRSDFGDSDAAVLETLKVHLSKADQSALGGSPRLKYGYDWNLNDISP